jgi:penicillin-binding protein 2
MSTDLDQVGELRPEVARPSETARQAAYARLLEAMDDEPTALHDRHSRRDARRTPRSVRRPRFGTLVALVGSVASIVVVIAAIALLGHSGRSTQSGASAGAVTRGAILARGGQTLVTTGTANYPFGNLAAQVLGTVSTGATRHAGQPDASSAATEIGQTGLEAEYQSRLAAGETLRTSIDPSLQRAAQRSLDHAVRIHGRQGGAFVAMNPQNGSIYAMGSNPTFDPQEFARGISQAKLKALDGPAADQSLVNRAIQTASPVGSAFKPITAIAALQSGAWPLDKIYDDTGTFTIASGFFRQTLHNTGGAAYGELNVQRALQVADDNFFYNLGAVTNATTAAGGSIQTWAGKLGIGQRPGIDLPGASAGTLPDPQWRARQDKLETECEQATGGYRYTNGTGAFSATLKTGYHRSHTHRSCGIADSRPWSIGDNISLAVGQGDVQVSPLQLAVAYSAIANGGTLVTPHLATALQDRDGTSRTLSTPPAHKLGLNPTNLAAIQTGLRRASGSPGGTSDDVFKGFPEPVYGQVGTVQYIPTSGPLAGEESDYAWYAGYVPATSTRKPVVVVVWIQNGGFGDTSAAPVAKQILSKWFTGHPGPYTPGRSPAS